MINTIRIITGVDYSYLREKLIFNNNLILLHKGNDFQPTNYLLKYDKLLYITMLILDITVKNIFSSRVI